MAGQNLVQHENKPNMQQTQQTQMPAPSPIPLMRRAVFGISLFVSIIVLALSAHITTLTTTFLSFYFVYCAMGITVALLTLLLVGVMLVGGRINNESVPTKVVFELPCLSLLWVLWLATGGLAATAFNGSFLGGCGYINADVDTACRETQAILAFSFIAWLALMGYTITLLVFAIVSSSRGNPNSFSGSVLTTNFLAPFGKQHNGHLAHQYTGQTQGSSYPPSQGYPQTGPYPPEAPAPGVYPPQGHEQYPSQGYPQQPGAGGSPYSQPGQHPGTPQV
ncbi:hypothetical protein DL96DRAFT_1553443 [Flagelloscypha sp. PMI_526]|nr:hypothetical protein DL96DRAFT_1553443 [Flagelloscypha sp. PMI_526]